MFLSKELDEKLIMTFELYNQKMCEALPDDEELKDITFSEAFEKKMQKLISMQRKSYYYMINTVGKRVAIIVSALVISLTATAFSVKAIREAIIEFFVETFTTYSEVSVDGDEISGHTEFKKVKPQYLPEGFNLSRDLSDEYSCFIEYIDSKENTIFYSQRINDGDTTFVDTEDVGSKTVYINGLEGIIYENKGVNRITFGDEKYFYNIYGQVSSVELKKIAESIPLE